MSLNRPHLVAPSARNQNNRIVPQPLRNSLPHQQVATLAATHDDSLNTSDMCMTEPISSKLYTTDIDMSHTTGDMLLTPVAGDTSSGDISFTLCEPGRPVNNVSTSMNFTSAANEAVSNCGYR
ncbi:hypothetical protein LSTR_LSTR016330 [Laodelphax striatellus]|uniref:Uncharacterized protein n=1 Tax=Laodelphax striatellus TaxID=195883 RepID=A0A482WWT6_LAOST|nr:hypothetical protein LSTR_LSTR016330 [Laodelphax striatellus]